MLSRLLVVLGLASLLALPALTLAGCSSSQKRDQYYGTDVGTDFQIPDAAGFPSQAPDAAAADVADVAPDTGLEGEHASQPDAQVAVPAEVAPDTGLEDVPVDAPAEDSGPDIDS
jgi:hypothetical protein